MVKITMQLNTTIPSKTKPKSLFYAFWNNFVARHCLHNISSYPEQISDVSMCSFGALVTRMYRFSPFWFAEKASEDHSFGPKNMLKTSFKFSRGHPQAKYLFLLTIMGQVLVHFRESCVFHFICPT